MPRESSLKYDGGHHYPGNPTPYPQPATDSYLEPQQIVPVIQDPLPKKKHVCPTCDRTFTTSGHLARHARVHTGEKNHQCPFPNCKTRCSRQDNLQQHYRIHLSPGSRRRSTAASRTAMIRSYNGEQPASAKRGSAPTLSTQLPPINYPSPPPPPPSPPIDPPALEQAYTCMPPGPDSPPPLAQANLPGIAAPPYDAESASSRSASPPEYIPAPVQPTNEYLPVAGYPLGMAHVQYGNGTTHSYQDHSQQDNNVYSYENGHTHSQPGSAVDNGIHDQTFGYTNSYGDHHSTQQQQMVSSPAESSPPPGQQYSPVSSRHSISHISHPSAYSNAAPPPPYLPASVPPSPASARSSGSSHASMASGPHTPNYTYQEDVPENNGYHTTESPFEHLPDASSCISAGYFNTQNDMVTNTNTNTNATYAQVHGGQFSNRYHSSPPILAPTQERLLHTEMPHAHIHAHSSPSTCMPLSAAPSSHPQMSPYLHHPRPISGAPQYHQHTSHSSLPSAEWGKPHAALPVIHH